MLVMLSLFFAPASADMQVSGNRIRVHYNDSGVWNSGSYGRGMDIGPDPSWAGDWRDVTYAGAPWQQVTINFEQAGSSHSHEMNQSSGMTMSPTLALDESDASEKVVVHDY